VLVKVSVCRFDHGGGLLAGERLAHLLSTECLPSPNRTPSEWHPFTGADQQFPQTPVGVNYGSYYPGTIDITATTMTTAVQDLNPWEAALCLSNLTDVATAACFQVAQQPLAPGLSGPPLLDPSPVAHQDSPSEPNGRSLSHVTNYEQP
jgi:hypothetical protein